MPDLSRAALTSTQLRICRPAGVSQDRIPTRLRDTGVLLFLLFLVSSPIGICVRQSACPATIQKMNTQVISGQKKLVSSDLTGAGLLSSSPKRPSRPLVRGNAADNFGRKRFFSPLRSRAQRSLPRDSAFAGPLAPHRTDFRCGEARPAFCVFPSCVRLRRQVAFCPRERAPRNKARKNTQVASAGRKLVSSAPTGAGVLHHPPEHPSHTLLAFDLSPRTPLLRNVFFPLQNSRAQR